MSITLHFRLACTSAYSTSGFFKYVFPLAPFDGEIVLDFAVQTPADAILSLSTDGTFEGIQYELGKLRINVQLDVFFLDNNNKSFL